MIAFDGLLNHKFSSAAKFGYFGIVFTVNKYRLIFMVLN